MLIFYFIITHPNSFIFLFGQPMICVYYCNIIIINKKEGWDIQNFTTKNQYYNDPVHIMNGWNIGIVLYLPQWLRAPSMDCVPSFVHPSIWTTFGLVRPERAFVTCCLGSCWNLNRFYVGRWFIRLFRCSKH